MNKGTDISHMLTISDLHNAAPGVLDVVTGPDGDFEEAPEWRPALYMLVGRRFVHDWQRTDDVIWLDLPPHGRVAHGQVALDLRVPSVAARLAGLCLRVVEGDRIIFDGSPPIYAGEFLRAAMCSPSAGGFDSALAAELAALTLALAPKIATLNGTP